MSSLETIGKSAGAGSEIMAYLADRKVKTVPTLALMAKDENALEKVVITPLMSGWKCTDGSVIKLADVEKPIAEAVLRHMWTLSCQEWAAQQSSAASTTTAGPTSTSTTSKSSGEEKVPKQLPSGVWALLINNYESQQIQGQDRTFPIQEVIGADQTLARIYHELHTSKLFTPVGLGEILSKRTFQASGEPNPLSRKEKPSTTFTVANEQLVALEDTPWQPRSVLSILDGLASIRWAYILVGMGPENSVHMFFDWLVKLVRSRPNKTDQVGQFCQTISWKLAMELRGGKAWDEAIQPIMRDYDTFTECMNREPANIVKKQPPPKPPAGDGYGKAKGKTKTKDRWTPYPRRDRNQQQTWNDHNSQRNSSSWNSSSGSQGQSDRNNWQNDSWSSDWTKNKK